MTEVGTGVAGSRRFERRAMGSPLRLTVVGPPAVLERDAPRAWLAVDEEFDFADAALSAFRATSSVSRLNATAGSGRLVTVESRLYRALAASSRAWRVTAGRFDPRVFDDLVGLGHPALTASMRSLANERQESPETGTMDTRDDGAQWLRRLPRERAVAITRRVDLSGIGKGLALRWAWRRLEAQVSIGTGTGALLEAGGDLVAGGLAPDGGPWRIGIEDPAGSEAPVAVVDVVNGALCTSSVRLNRWTTAGGQSAHHLIDPLTHAPGGAGMVSVTVAAADPAWAEIWSKSLFLSGSARIAETARRTSLAAWWVTAAGALEMTARARVLTRWP